MKEFQGSETWILSDLNDRNALHPANHPGRPFHIPVWSQMQMSFWRLTDKSVAMN